MNLKDELIKMKEALLNIFGGKVNDFIKSDHDYELSDKVDEFIEWYRKSLFLLYEETELRYFRLRNFIEKMATWYELRYPEQKIDEILSGKLDEKSKTNDWNVRDEYGYDTFLEMLNNDEKKYLIRPDYPALIYPIKGHRAHFHVSKDGIIEDSEGMDFLVRGLDDGGAGSDTYFKGRLLKVALAEFPMSKELKNGELYKTVRQIEIIEEIQMRILYCAMYRIIERGYRNYGAKRAFLFAKEFRLDLEIPMMYGVDFDDIKMRDFVIAYIETGSDTNINCLNYYGLRKRKNQKLEIVSFPSVMHYYKVNPMVKKLKNK